MTSSSATPKEATIDTTPHQNAKLPLYVLLVLMMLPRPKIALLDVRVEILKRWHRPVGTWLPNKMPCWWTHGGCGALPRPPRAAAKKTSASKKAG
jgi:hypothetical protein